MAVFNNILAGSSGQAAGGGGYAIERSLRFNSADSSFLSRTPASVGNRKTWTWAGWVKRSNLTDAYNTLFSATAASYFAFQANGTLLWYEGSTLITAQLFRDVSAWYHIVLAYDSTQATASDRIKVYINGAQVTSFSAANYPAQNTDSAVNSTGEHNIGKITTLAGTYLSGYLADVHFIDGQALDPTSFGEFDDNGIWQPITYTPSASPNDGTVWSSTTSTSGFGDYDGVTGVFDGNLSTRGGDSDTHDATYDTLFSGASISVTSTIRLYWNGIGSGQRYIRINDTTEIAGGTGSLAPGWESYSYSGSLSKLEVKSANTGSYGLSAVEIDGVILIDSNTSNIGTNGFHLDFADNSSAAALGYDAAGSNDWTVNNISPISNPQTQTFSGFFWTQYKSAYNNNTIAQTKTGSKYRIPLDDLFSGVADGTSYSASQLFGITKFNSQGYIHDSLTSADGTATTGFANSSYTGSFWKGYFNYPANSGKYASITVYDGSDPNGTDYAINRSDCDSLVDVPTNGTEEDTGVGGEVRGNYATFNPLASAGSFSNGNLRLDVTSGIESSGISTIGLPQSGKWYWEVTMDTIGSDPYTGITNGTSRTSLGSACVAYRGNGGFYSLPSATLPSTGAAYTTGDVIGMAFNADILSLAFYKNGASQGTVTNITAGQYFTLCYCYNVSARTANFGQRPFAYQAPAGFKSLCTANLPAPTIEDPSTVMDAVLWTGDNTASRAITGLNFSPDLLWIKSRSAGGWHALADSVRGAGKILASNSTNSEYDNTDSNNAIQSFDSNGFTIGQQGGWVVNDLSVTQVAWTWDAGSSTVTNNDGSITSSVRANASAGFSIVTWPGTGPTASVGHGLGVAPQFWIQKSRSSAGVWNIYHSSLGPDKYLQFNTASAGTASGIWGTGPTSTVMNLGGGFGVNNSPVTYVAYCFAPVAGYSAFGSYTGNNSTDGPFVYTGFRPRYILIKRAELAESWAIRDTSRSPYNSSISDLSADSDGLEYSSASFNNFDILSNGFKPRNTRDLYNASGSTYIYAAFAENPFALNARAR